MKHLMVGGHQDGNVLEVPPGRHEIVCAVPYAIRAVSIYEANETETALSLFETERYIRREVKLFGRVLVVYVYADRHFTSDYLMANHLLSPLARALLDQ